MTVVVKDIQITKLLKKILLGFLLVVTVLILSISAIVATQSGSRWAMQKISVATQVTLGEIRGNLLTGLDVANVNYDKNELSVSAKNIKFRWQPFALFYASVSVQSFMAETVRIKIPPKKDQTEPDHFDWPSLSLPVSVELGKLQLKDISVERDKSQFFIDTVTGALSLGRFRFRAKELVVSNKEFYSKNNGSLVLDYPYSFNLKTDWRFSSRVTRGLAIAGQLTASGDVKKLVIKNNLAQPFAVETIADLVPALHIKKQKPSAKIVSKWLEQNIPRDFIERIGGKEQPPFFNTLLTTQGELLLEGWLDQYKISGVTNSKTADAIYKIEASLEGNNLSAEGNQAPEVKLKIDQLKLVRETLASDARDMEKSDLHLTGNLNFSSAIDWDLLFQGRHINVGHFYPGWPSDLQIDLNSRGRISNRKSAFADNWNSFVAQASVKSQLAMQGELRATQFAANANLVIGDAKLESSDIKVTFGANRLSLAKKIARTKKIKEQEDLTFEWKIDAPLLNQIDPGLSGSILSSGIFNGDFVSSFANSVSLAKPSLKVTTEIRQLSWRNDAIEKLNLTVNSNKSHVYALSLDANNLLIQGQPLTRVALEGNGSLEDHSLKGTVKSLSGGALEFSLSGSWKENIWQGIWHSLSLDLKKIPGWYLSSSSPIVADKTHVDLGKVCLTTEVIGADRLALRRPQASPVYQSVIDPSSDITGQLLERSQVAIQETPQICATSSWKDQSDFFAKIEAAAVPLNHLRSWLKPEVTVAGVLDSQLDIHWSPKDAVSAGLSVQARGAQLSYQFRGGGTDVYQLKEGSLKATLKNNQVDSMLVLDWGKYGAVNADAKYSLVDKKIRGKITALLSDIAPLESLLPSINDIQGSASANIDVAGRIDSPQITGNFSIVNARANVPKLGLDFTEMSLQMASKSAGLIHIDGQVLSGKGRLILRGDLTNLGAENWHCSGNIFGADISIIRQPELSATISPNLTFTADAGAINLNGSTEIPWARTAIKSLPASATALSNDVTIVRSTDSFQQLTTSKHSIPFYTNVILYFGDDVRFKGFGLDGQLSGKINVFKEENRQAQTTGFVAINQGVYKAYGQELSIARGRLLFQGPYENPGLDIRAIRLIDTEIAGKTITAGIEVGGTLQRPKSTVFSIPARDDSNAMALLLTGKNKDQLSIGDAYVLINAVDNMGVENGSSITEDITRFFRLDEITIKSDKGLDQSVLWVGKYITPKLFMRYVVGLYDQAFSLGMRYQLTDRVRLEATSGKEQQGVDMIYKIER
jgi:translocation and assembly module TamB